MSEYRGVPERFKSEGVKISGNSLARIGEKIVAVSFVHGVIPKGTECTISSILIEPKPNSRGFTKRIRIKEYPGEFPPQSFKKR